MDFINDSLLTDDDYQPTKTGKTKDSTNGKAIFFTNATGSTKFVTYEGNKRKFYISLRYLRSIESRSREIFLLYSIP